MKRGAGGELGFIRLPEGAKRHARGSLREVATAGSGARVLNDSPADCQTPSVTEPKPPSGSEGSHEVVESHRCRQRADTHFESQ